MPDLLDRVTWEPEPAVGPQHTSVARLLAQLEAGATPAALEREESLAPTDLATALAAIALGDKERPGPHLVQARPTHPRLEPALHSIANHLGAGSPIGRLVLAAGLLQIFDFWDASHTAAQEADDRGDTTRLAALWHGIAHRREPDPGNASYWYRRVGRDPAGVFSALAKPATELLAANPTGWANRVLPNGAWDPFGFIEVCRAARPGSADEVIARKLQRLEMLATLQASLPNLSV